MHYLLIGYMFLFIHRPFEIWPMLGDMHVERLYMIGTLAYWLIYPGKRWLSNLQHIAYAGFAFSVLACWAISPWSERTQPIVEDWLKILVFYVLLVTSVHEEKGLRRLAIGFMCVMAIYLTHSLREYMGGRHTYRMGIARMIGVDSTLGDPNSFGASIVFVLPFITALWQARIWGKWGRIALLGYTGLSVLCILLTGSRSSLLGLGLWAALLMFRVKRAWLWLMVLAVLSPVGFHALPPSLQNRFETIIHPEVGPANAQESGEGRIQGFMTGIDLLMANPLTGVGPGAWRPATKSNIESHNLFGQLMGELGGIGIFAFVFLIWNFRINLKRMAKIRKQYPEWKDDLLFQLSSAIGTSIILLLFMGNFGHNLFRYTWLWYGGFLIIARYCVEKRIREYQPVALVEAEYEDEDLYDEIPDGWIVHEPHTA